MKNHIRQTKYFRKIMTDQNSGNGEAIPEMFYCILERGTRCTIDGG